MPGSWRGVGGVRQKVDGRESQRDRREPEGRDALCGAMIEGGTRERKEARKRGGVMAELLAAWTSKGQRSRLFGRRPMVLPRRLLRFHRLLRCLFPQRPTPYALSLSLLCLPLLRLPTCDRAPLTSRRSPGCVSISSSPSSSGAVNAPSSMRGHTPLLCSTRTHRRPAERLSWPLSVPSHSVSVAVTRRAVWIAAVLGICWV